jgi:hypothetical protein
MIHIKDDYYIDADETQFILKEDKHRVDKEGRPIFDSLGYYGTFKQAVSGFLKMEQRGIIANGPDRELDEAFRDMNLLVIELENLLNNTEVK